MNKTETKGHLKKTLQLTSKTLYKTVEFQLLFKLFYVGIILFLTNFFLSNFFNATDAFIAKIHFDETLQSIPVISLFEFKIIFVLIASLFVLTFVYLTEKNGVIIITSEYYRNNFIGFFKAFFLSMYKTPLFILRRLHEMRFAIFIFIGLYILWKIMMLFTLPSWFTIIFATMLIIYGVGMLLFILFHYTFTAYVTCLEPAEKPIDFNNQMPDKFLRKRFHAVVIFYIIFILAILLWLLFFYGVTQVLLYFSTAYPASISTILPFFIAFTIMSILIVLSLFKTIKVSLMTILYYQERNRQNKNAITDANTKQPRLSKNIYLAFIAIFVIAFVGGIIITSSIKPRTTYVINHAPDYIQQVKKEQTLLNVIRSKDVDIPKITQETLTNKKSSLDIIEKVIFTYLAYIIDK